MNTLRWVSGETKPKEDDFRGIIRMHTTLCKGILARSSSRPYLYVDLFAGPGWIPDGDDRFEGSPLIAQTAMLDAGFPYQSIHFEQDPETAGQLRKALWEPRSMLWYPDPDSELVYAERCQEGFARWLDANGRQQDRFGLVYADPISDEIPHALLNKAADLLPRVDLLSYVAATQYKRRRGVDSDRPYLADHIRAVRKKVVLIREPIGAWQFTFILWSNWVDFPQWTKRGFYRLDSARGDQILDKLNLTARRRHEEANTPLPFPPTGPTPNTSGIPGSSLSAPKSSNGLAGSVNAAGNGQRPNPTISPIHPGGPSTSLRTSSPSATPATAAPTGRSDDGEP